MWKEISREKHIRQTQKYIWQGVLTTYERGEGDLRETREVFTPLRQTQYSRSKYMPAGEFSNV